VPFRIASGSSQRSFLDVLNTINRLEPPAKMPYNMPFISSKPSVREEQKIEEVQDEQNESLQQIEQLDQQPQPENQQLRRIEPEIVIIGK
jgi:hypothetical protein